MSDINQEIYNFGLSSSDFGSNTIFAVVMYNIIDNGFLDAISTATRIVISMEQDGDTQTREFYESYIGETVVARMKLRKLLVDRVSAFRLN